MGLCLRRSGSPVQLSVKLHYYNLLQCLSGMNFSLNQIFIPAWGLHLENYVLIVWASCINKKRQCRCQLETISQSPSVYTRKMRCIILPWGQGIYAWIYVCWYLLVSLVTRDAQGNVLLSQEPGTQCGCSNKMTIIVGLIVEPSLA